MLWAVLAAGAAVLWALQGAWTKRLTAGVTPAVTTWAIFGFSLPLLAAWLAIRGLPPVEGSYWAVLAANSALYLLSFRLYVSALEAGDLGVVYPLLALTPVLAAPVEWVLLGDRVGALGAVGVGLVAAGVYLLHHRGAGRPLLEPLRAMADDPGARRMLAVAALWAVSGTVDRAAVLRSSPAFYGTSVALLLSLGLLPAALRSGRGGTPGPGGASDAVEGSRARAGLAAALRRRPGALAVQGILFAGMFVVQMEALRLALATYVLTVKRSGTLLAVLLGGALFREGGTGRRLAGTAIVLAGVALVVLS